MSELKSLMLWKDDFKSERAWEVLCKALDLSVDTVEIEMNCNVCVAKSHYTHQHKFNIDVNGLSDEELCFIDDEEKVVDFVKLSKEEFLASYSYLTEEEYDATKRVFALKKATLDSKLSDATKRSGESGHKETANENFVKE